MKKVARFSLMRINLERFFWYEFGFGWLCERPQCK